MPELSNQTKCLLIVVGVAILFYIISKKSTAESFANEEEVVVSSSEDLADVPVDDSNNNTASDSPMESQPSDESAIAPKLLSKNSAVGSYKRSNYVDGQRGNGTSEFDAFFDEQNNLVTNSYLTNDRFEGNEESKDSGAPYAPGPRKPLSDADIFNSQNYLPQESHKDWFDVMPEPISVKNRHLINVSRPIGVNTIGTTLKNATYDLRGSPPCPKFVVSPWLQSTIEPDYNIKGLC
jgi:hypothetical protein